MHPFQSLASPLPEKEALSPAHPNSLRGLDVAEIPVLLGHIPNGALEAFAPTEQVESRAWRIVGREMVEKVLPSPAQAKAMLAVLAGSTNGFAEGRTEMVIHRPDLIPLAVAVAALSSAAVLASRMKIPGTAPGMSHSRAVAISQALKVPGEAARIAAQTVSQDHRRIASAMVTPLDALMHAGVGATVDHKEVELLVDLIAGVERGDFDGALPEFMLNEPGRGELGICMAESQSPIVRQAFRDEIATWIADAHGFGEERPNLSSSARLYLDSCRPGEVKDLLESIERALAQASLKPGDLGRGPAEVVGMVVDQGIRNAEGTELAAFRVANLAAIRFGRVGELERLSRATSTLVASSFLEGRNPGASAMLIGDALRRIHRQKDLRAGEAERIEAAIQAGVNASTMEAGPIRDLLKDGGLAQVLAERPLRGVPLATPADKAEFLKAFDDLKGKVPVGLASMAHLIRSDPQQGVTAFGLSLAMMDMDNLKIRSLEENLRNSLAPSMTGPATERQVRMLGSLERQFQARGLRVTPVLDEVLQANRDGKIVSQIAAQIALAEARVAIIEDDQRAAGIPNPGMKPKKEQES